MTKVIYPSDPEFKKLMEEGKVASGADANASEKELQDNDIARDKFAKAAGHNPRNSEK